MGRRASATRCRVDARKAFGARDAVFLVHARYRERKAIRIWRAEVRRRLFEKTRIQIERRAFVARNVCAADAKIVFALERD